MTSSTLKQQISTAFFSVGHPPLPPALLSQITAVSTSLRLTPNQLAEAWEAHSLTKDVTVLNDATMSGYRTFLAKEAGVDASMIGKNSKNVTVIHGTGLGKRTAPGSNVTPSPMAKRATVTTAGNSNTTSPGDNKGSVNRNGLSAVDNLTTPSGKGAVSPAGKKQPGSAAMVITPPKATMKYTNRTNAGQLVSSYNPHNLPTTLEVLSSKSTAEKERIATHVACNISPHPSTTHPQSGFRHMFTPLEKRAGVLENRLNDMNRTICDVYDIKNEDEEMIESMDGVVKSENGQEKISTWTPVNVPKQNKVLCVGRICNEAHEGRLNRASIRLEGSREHSNGSRIQLDLQGLNNNEDSKQSYSFFPGQIVAVEGVNSSGRKLQASRLIEGVAPPKETLAAKELLEYQYGSELQDGNPLSIVSMCGPFTTKDNLDYDPLLDAITKISEDKPDVVIMCGPFVDGRQPLVAGEDGSGGAIVQDDNGNEKTVSYEYLFATKISLLLEDLYKLDPELKTQFVLVPSVDDAFLDAVYPQSPLETLVGDVPIPKDVAIEFGDLGLSYVELVGRETKKRDETRQRRVHCVSNPCTLQINDVTIGVTSTDVLFHISSDECNANLAPGTRLTRIAQHLIQQRSYYPLFPAAKGASLDLSKSKQWEMPIQPDILIVPSKLASFARNVSESTIVVNPGELTKNTTGGTYAVIDVHPMKKDVLESGVEADGEMVKGMQDRVRVDIKRI